MKIAFVVHDLVGQGVQYATAAMVRAFHARGYEVDLLVSKAHDIRLAAGEHPFSVPEDITWIRMPYSQSKRNIPALRRYLKGTDAEFVIAESLLYAIAIRIAIIGLQKIPKIVQVHHWNESLPSGSWYRRLWMRLYRSWLYRRFYAMFFVNDLARVRFAMHSNYPTRLQTVYNVAVDDIFFSKIKEKPTHPWLLKKSMPTLVCAGSCNAYKDHMTLLKAMEIVNKSMPVRLVLFGRGPLIAQYEAFVKSSGLEDRISVGGYTNNLPAELHAADAFVLSSRAESFGIVVAEALASGLYVLSTDAPDGPREILENGKYGALVPVGDSVALAQAIITYLSGPRIQNPPESWNRFTEEAITNRYLIGLGLA